MRERRSIHTFKQIDVDDAVLQEIFTHASWAPTHYMKEPWNIKLYQEDGKRDFVDAIITSYQHMGMIPNNEESKTLRMIDSMSNFLLNIPHHALIYFPLEDDPVRYEEEYAAVCAFIQNTQLAAWTYGVGILWTITPYMHDPLFYERVAVDKGKFKIAAVLQIGYPVRIPQTKGRTSIKDKLEIIRK